MSPWWPCNTYSHQNRCFEIITLDAASPRKLLGLSHSTGTICHRFPILTSYAMHKPAVGWHPSALQQPLNRPLTRCPLCAGQRPNSSTSSSTPGSAGTKGREHTHHRPAADKTAQPPLTPSQQQQQHSHNKQKAPVPVPEVGWLWTIGTKPAAGQVSAQMTITDLRKDRISAKKSLGQNFLTDDGILKEIVSAAGVQPGDCVLEVGPGTGNLTKWLLAAGAHVTAVEKDDVLYARLASTYEKEPNLRLVHEDVLHMDMNALLREMLGQRAAGLPPSQTTSPSTSSASEDHAHTADQPTPSQHAATSAPTSDQGAPTQQATAAQPEIQATSQPQQPQEQVTKDSSPHDDPPSPLPSPRRGGVSRANPTAKVKVVANLPYNITTDFLKATLPAGHLVSDLHIMLQEEAGVRLVRSAPGDKDYRAMSLRVALYSKPKYRFRIPKSKYYPAPGVDGALITFRLLPPGARLPLPSERGFITAIEKAFGERRKMLRNSLQPLFSAQQVEHALTGAGLSPLARAQDLSVSQWAEVYRSLHAQVVAEEVDEPTAEMPTDEAASQ